MKMIYPWVALSAVVTLTASASPESDAIYVARILQDEAEGFTEEPTNVANEEYYFSEQTFEAATSTNDTTTITGAGTVIPDEDYYYVNDTSLLSTNVNDNVTEIVFDGGGEDGIQGGANVTTLNATTDVLMEEQELDNATAAVMVDNGANETMVQVNETDFVISTVTPSPAPFVDFDLGNETLDWNGTLTPSPSPFVEPDDGSTYYLMNETGAPSMAPTFHHYHYNGTYGNHTGNGNGHYGNHTGNGNGHYGNGTNHYGNHTGNGHYGNGTNHHGNGNGNGNHHHNNNSTDGYTLGSANSKANSSRGNGKVTFGLLLGFFCLFCAVTIVLVKRNPDGLCATIVRCVGLVTWSVIRCPFQLCTRTGTGRRGDDIDGGYYSNQERFSSMPRDLELT